jgi:hypothetical protein
MKNLKSTVGYVGSEGVMLEDHSIFEKGEVVIVLSAESFDEFFNELNDVKKNLDKSKKWIDEIKEMKKNNLDH